MKRFFLLVFLLAVSSVFAVTPAEVAAYRKAADQGDAKAQFNLGNCYANGNGVQKDLTQAVFWYRKAADQGYVEAQYNLGQCYRIGYGVQKDAHIVIDALATDSFDKPLQEKCFDVLQGLQISVINR